jgi:hypothetical protein
MIFGKTLQTLPLSLKEASGVVVVMMVMMMMMMMMMLLLGCKAAGA